MIFTAFLGLLSQRRTTVFLPSDHPPDGDVAAQAAAVYKAALLSRGHTDSVKRWQSNNKGSRKLFFPLSSSKFIVTNPDLSFVKRKRGTRGLRRAACVL